MTRETSKSPEAGSEFRGRLIMNLEANESRLLVGHSSRGKFYVFTLFLAKCPLLSICDVYSVQVLLSSLKFTGSLCNKRCPEGENATFRNNCIYVCFWSHLGQWTEIFS